MRTIHSIWAVEELPTKSRMDYIGTPSEPIPDAGIVTIEPLDLLQTSPTYYGPRVTINRKPLNPFLDRKSQRSRRF